MEKVLSWEILHSCEKMEEELSKIIINGSSFRKNQEFQSADYYHTLA